MRQYFSYISLFVSLAFGIILAFLPLTQVWGYESSFASALFFSIFLPVVYRYGKNFRSLWFSVLATQIPVLVADLFWAENCDWSSSPAYFLTVALGSAFFSVALSYALDKLFRKSLYFYLSYFGIFLFFIGMSCHSMLTEVRVVDYNPFFGYFAGSIYDEALDVFEKLWLYRLFNVFQLGLLLSLIFLVKRLKDRRRSMISGFLHSASSLVKRPKDRSGVRIRGDFGIFCILVFSVATMYYMHPALAERGINPSGETAKKILGSRAESEHFIVYYRFAKEDPEKEKRVLRDSERRYRQLKRYFAMEPKRKVEVFCYPDYETKFLLTGTARTLVSKPWLNAIHILDRGEGNSTLLHELAHIFAGVIGEGPLKLVHLGHWLPQMGWVEGLAVAAENPVRTLDIFKSAAAMLRLDLAPMPSELSSATGFYRHASRKSYTVMGSFVAHLVEKYGIAAVKRYLQSHDFEKSFGMTFDDVQNDWLSRLRAVELSDAEIAWARGYFDRPSIFGKKCARALATYLSKADRYAESGMYPYAKHYIDEVMRHDGDNPVYRLSRIDFLCQFNRYDEASEELVKVERLHEGQWRENERRALAELKADLAWLIDVDAHSPVYAVLAESEVNEENRIRLFLKSLGAHSKYRAMIRDFALERHKKAQALLFAGESDLANYLKGRVFFESGAYDKAIRALKGARDLPTILKNHRDILLASSYDRSGHALYALVFLATIRHYDVQKMRNFIAYSGA